ncbi:hypothetical protein ES703_38802 [subsurface metagenome]
MDLTIKQAVYSILSASLLKGAPFFRYGTIKAIREALEKVYGVKISRQYAGSIIREIAKESHLLEYTGKREFLPHLYWPREKLYKLAEPGNILRAKKWKRDGSPRGESPGGKKYKANPS